MPTYHQSLLAAVLATQQALPSVPAARVYAERQAPVELDECPAINLALDSSRKQAVLGGQGDYDLLMVVVQFTLSIHTRGEPHTTVADPVAAQAHLALMADPTLGGLAQRLSYTGSQPRRAPAEGSAGILDLTYESTVCVDERTLAVFTHN